MRYRPVVHFAILGGLLFMVAQWRAGAVAPHDIIGASLDHLGDEEVLYRAAVMYGLDREDPVVQARLIRNMQFLADGDTAAASLYREAVQLSMADGDLVVRRRLVERMRLLLQEPALAAEPSEAELRAYLDAHAESLGSPATVRLTHVFLSRQRRGAALEADAAQLLRQLDAGDVDRAAELADPLPLPADLPSASQQELERRFGRRFAAAALSAEPGRWQGPLSSPYGMHLIWVRERTPARPADLAAVRAQVRAALREERAAAALRDGLRALRAGRTPWGRIEQGAPRGNG